MEWSNAILNARDIKDILNNKNVQDYNRICEIQRIQNVIKQSIKHYKTNSAKEIC